MTEQQATAEQNLANSISMLEQILEVMPQDSDALRAVYSAYHKTGQDEQAFEYLGRIIGVYLGGGDDELLHFIRTELDHYAAAFPSEVAAHQARLRGVDVSEIVSEDVERPKSVPRQSTTDAGKQEVDISEELALAWRLYEENQLTQEEYSSVLHDLTEVSSKQLNVPVSVLHVLNDRGFTQMKRIMNYLSTRSGVPCITLSSYELSEEVSTALPTEISAHNGALPFAFLGNDLLLAVLNPFNNSLVDKVESICGHHCHTYLVEPEDYDLALGRLRAVAERASPPSQS